MPLILFKKPKIELQVLELGSFALRLLDKFASVINLQGFQTNNGHITPSYEEGASSGSTLKSRLKELHQRSCY